MSKKLKVDFYKVEMPDGVGVSFETIVQKVSHLNTDETKAVDVRGVPIMLYQASQWGECWEGNIIRIRMTEVPVRASRKGTVTAFNLAEDEGMGEQTAFLYHPQTRVLLLQSSQSGVSVSALAKYFEILGNISQPIFVDPVIQKDALQRLEKITAVRRFEIKTAGLESMQIFSGPNRGIEEMIHLSQAFRSPHMEISLSVGRSKKKSLPLKVIQEAVAALNRISIQPDNQVSKLRISGCTEDNELVYLDLLQDRMREIVEIESPQGRNSSYTHRQETIRKAWECRRDELFSMYIG